MFRTSTSVPNSAVLHEGQVARQVERNRAGVGKFGRGKVEHQLHPLTLVQRDGVGLDHARFVLDEAQPARVVGKRRGEVERSVAVAGVLETEVHEAVIIGADGGGNERNRGGQGHAELFADGQIHAQSGLFTELSTAGVGEPEVPVLLLNLGTGGHREVGPELDRLARTNGGMMTFVPWLLLPSMSMRMMG